MDLIEFRCQCCGHLLGKMIGIAEIKCKCGTFNYIGIAPTSAGTFELKIERQRAPKIMGVRHGAF